MSKFKEKFRNYSVNKKLTITFTFIITMISLLSLLLIFGIKFVEGKLVKLYNGPMMNIHYSASLYYPQIDIQRMVNRVLAEGPEKGAEMYSELDSTVNEDLRIMDEAYNNLKSTLLTEEDQRSLDKINSFLNNTVTPYREEVLRLLKEGKYNEAAEYNNKNYKPSVDEVKVMIHNLEDSIIETAEEFETSAVTNALILIIGGGVFLFVTIVIAIYIAESLKKMLVVPLKEVTEAIEKLSAGDLSGGDIITYESEDEIGVLSAKAKLSINTLRDYVKEISDNLELVASGDLSKKYDDITNFLGDFVSIKKSFVKTLSEFNKTLSSIAEGSHDVDLGSDEIASASQELATGTGEQSTAIEALRQNINNLNNLVIKSAETANTAAEQMTLSVKEAEIKKENMKSLQEEMLNIKEISNEISTIATSIEDIASQTSLLALNASIEAARAGEAGRGFAVVADQIGKLATDSAQAVVNVKELISKTVDAIDKGDKMTEVVAEGFEKIVFDLNNFTSAATASGELSDVEVQALKDVLEELDQISAVTQQTAASGEECSAISEELAARATEMMTQVQKFKLFK